MIKFSFPNIIKTLALSGAAIVLPACEGIFSGVYDEPVDDKSQISSGQLYIDASDWLEWHYMDFHAISADGVAVDNPSDLWETYRIPTATATGADERTGIYTYWYDVYGAGLANREFRNHTPTLPQEEPAEWSIAVHRNNVRTNGGAACRTSYRSIEDLPSDPDFLNSLDYTADTWNETDVWVIQEKMLLGLIGNQGIATNAVLSSWLRVDIPPMPPTFSLDNSVYVVRFADGTHAALQLQDYQSSTGTKCCLTINYKYPI